MHIFFDVNKSVLTAEVLHLYDGDFAQFLFRKVSGWRQTVLNKRSLFFFLLFSTDGKLNHLCVDLERHSTTHTKHLRHGFNLLCITPPQNSFVSPLTQNPDICPSFLSPSLVFISPILVSSVSYLFQTSNSERLLQICSVLLRETRFEISHLEKWLAFQIQNEWNSLGVNGVG